MIKNFLHLIIITTLFNSCSSTQKTSNVTPSDNPKVMREFRAAWVATVDNINWPSKPGLSTEQQQQEAIALLDFLQKYNFNAVILQVRPHADALYKSDIEPWSYYLTGREGKAPEPFYDPLTFWTEAAHDRGIELHVWLNPYRAHHPAGDSIISDQSIIKTNPNLVLNLKQQGYWWMDPSLKEVQDRTTNVVMDLVKRYDIDGVHFDDYFYPYPEYNKGEDFPDSVSWSAYQANDGKLSRGDWRRKSVNDLIERIYKEMKVIKPYVKFGLSPFGLWKPGYPESACCFDQYNVLYADAKLWLNKGWIDYFTPQLYWQIKRVPLSYPVLLGWWANENTKKRHLWPGINVGRDTGRTTVDETINQIMITRGMVPESKGVVHWSISSDVKNTSLQTALLTGPYKDGALVPSSPWLDKTAPEPPVVTATKEGDSLRISWTHPNTSDVFRWVVYYEYGNKWGYKILNRNDTTFVVSQTAGTEKSPLKLNRVAVTAVDRTGNESIMKE